MKSRIYLVIYLLLLCMPLSVVADVEDVEPEPDFNAGMEAYRSGDYETAVAIFEPLAVEGNQWAQFNLGLMYAEGRGVSRDDEQAFQWYLRSAEQGNAQAQAMVGAMYYLGHGVEPDYIEAYKWNSLAVENATDDDLRSQSATLKGEIANELPVYEIDEAERKAREWASR